MHGSTREPGYDVVAKSLHWLVAALLAVQFAIAWTMPAIHRDTLPQGPIDLHLSVGVLIMGVVVVRLIWRLGRLAPPPLDGLPLWQQRVAETTHGALYLLLLVLPVLGWASACGRGWSVGLFGLVQLPAILPKGAPFAPLIGDLHTVASYVLLGVVGLHALAALYHHFVLRDRTLARMLPGS